MSVKEKELPFDVEDDPFRKDHLEPGFYDQILTTDHMLKTISPYEIKTSVHQCFACNLRRYKKPLELSNFDASIMVIGETPSDVDFTTPEGKLLADALAWAKYDLDDIYFTSLIKCEESPTPDLCQHHLISEILCVSPKMIIALGYEVGRRLDPSVHQSGYVSKLLDRHDMITTYRTIFTMGSQQYFQHFCEHLLQAKQKLDSINQRSS